MYHSILVPLDGSPFGEHALPYAFDIARRTGAQLHLAHVYDTPPPEGRRHRDYRAPRTGAGLF